MAAPVELTRFTLPSSGNFNSSLYGAAPILADLDGDGKDELINPVAGSRLVAYKLNANNQPVLYQTYSTANSIENIKTTPVVVTLPNGNKAIFAALGRNESTARPTEDGRVYGWDAKTGAVLPGWPKSSGLNLGRQSGPYGPMASADLDGDGVPEILVTSFSHKVTAFRLDGSTLWTWDNDDTILSGVAVGDLDRDGRPEVVLGGDASNNGFYKAGGFVTILSSTGNLKYRRELPGETIWSTPSLVDVNNDGYLEIFVGTGLNYDFVTGGRNPDIIRAGNRIYGLDFMGRDLPGWPYLTWPDGSQRHQVISPVAIGDINQDGSPEVVAIDRLGFLHVVQTTGPNSGKALPAFAGGRPLVPDFPTDPNNANSASPIIADVDGDGRPDIVASASAFVVAVDRNGTRLLRGSVQLPGQPLPEYRFGAPAVGELDGRPGLELVSVSELGGNPTRPSSVIVYKLPPSTLTPPWPLQRKNALGRAASYSSAFAGAYVSAAYRAFLGRSPSATELSAGTNLILNNAIDLDLFARLIGSSAEARGRAVDVLYRQFLGRAADPAGRASWVNQLATRTVRDISVGFITSREFQQIGGTPRGVVALMYRYLLNREAGASELDSWEARMRAGTTIADIARIFFNAPEYINTQSTLFLRAAFGPNMSFSSDSAAALSVDFHAGEREEIMYARILVTGGKYAQAQPLSGYIRTLYRDLLNRDATQAELTANLQRFDARALTPAALAANLLNSGEARRIFVAESFQRLLGRNPTGTELANNQNYISRAALLQMLVSSDEYFRRKGSNNAAFVVGAYKDLANIDVARDPGTVDSQVRAIVAAGTRSVVPLSLLRSDLYFNKTAVDLIFRYLPNEDLGVLRTANTPPDQPQVAINPDPAVVKLIVDNLRAGRTPEQAIGILVTSDRYIRGSAFFKGIYRRQMVRN